MSQQNVLLKVKGLYTFPNHLSEIPNGALLEASNLVINRDSIAESRRGFKIYGNAMDSSISNTAHQLMDYKGRIFRHYGPNSGTTLEYDSDGVGTFLPFTRVFTGTTHSNTVMDGITSTAQLFVGMFVSGSGIAANTTIASITSNTAIVLSIAAGSSVTSSFTFNYKIQETSLGLRIKSIEQNGNFYFTTSEGIKKISVSNVSQLSSAAITNAGGVKALDLKATINAGAGFLSPSSVVAYRIVWGIKDANQNLILGTPSERVVVENTSTTLSKTVDLRITIPRGVTTAHFYQVYRTAVFSNIETFTFSGDTHNTTTTIDNIADTSSLVVGMSISGTGIQAGSTITSISSTSSIEISLPATADGTGITLTVSQTLDIDPGDEEALVYENNPTNSDITNGFVLITDITPDSFRGANLYTNANSGEGILQANDVPPLATDIATFKGYTFYANTQTRQRLNVSLLSVSQLVANTSTLTITDGTTSNTYTFKAAENTATKSVLISTLPTPAEQVDETARSLVHVINSQASEIVNAFYLSGPSDVPGLILLEAINLQQTNFHLTVNNAATTGIEFSPNLPSSGSSVISDNEVQPHRIYYSKVQQPEAVPILNFIDVGPQDKQILRILALRDNLFILKEEGIYRLSGLVAPFQVYPFDFSTNLKAPDSAVVLNNLIYMFSNQGINTVSDTQVSIISRPIEDQLIKLLTSQYTNFTTSTFGVTYETDRAYYVFTVTNIADTVATQCFRFNTFTNSWTLLDMSKRCGIVISSDDRFYIGATDTNFIEQERKLFDRTDFADREHNLVLGAASILGTTIKLPSVANISIGDVLTQVQYLNISQFNRLLTKLDNDSHLTPHDYVSVMTALDGINLSDQLDVLIAKIRDDAGRQSVAGHTANASYTALIGAGAGSFSALQSNFNALIDLLNADVGLGYKNYIHSTGTVIYELPITGVFPSTNTVTTTYEYPLIVGTITIYNHIDVSLQFVPQFLTDVSITKQASEGTLIFEDSSFTEAVVSYSSDLSANFESKTIPGNGPGTFGNFVYGNGIYGGNGSGIPFRTLIPRDKQRCRYLNVKFQHGVAREIFSLYGISLTFNPVSTKGWR